MNFSEPTPLRKQFTFFAFALFFILPSSLCAQVTITGADAWGPPKTEDWQETDTSNSIGPSGANVTWDFSSYNSTGTFQYIHQNPGFTPYFSEFPNADVARQHSVTNVYEYFTSDTNSLELLSFRGSDEWTVFSDPWQYISYPITYPDSMVDQQVSLIAFANPTDTVKRTATTAIKIDGYGSLKLDYITLTGVLRMKQVVDFSDSSYNFVTVNGTEEYYWWWAPGQGMIAINSNRYGAFRVFAWRTDLVVSRESEILGTSVTVFPNPTGEKATIEFELTEPTPTSVSILSLSGELLDLRALNIGSAGKHKVDFDLSDLAAGTYLVQINTGSDVVTEKLVVAR